MFNRVRIWLQSQKTLIVVFLLGSLFGGTQQCSNVRLFAPTFESDFSSRGFPFRLYPPSDREQYRRYVFLVDMSQSMIAGPCPFDVGNGPLFHTRDHYRGYDPNKSPDVDIDDGRAAARDCYVDTNLPIRAGEQLVPSPYKFGQQYGTFKGSDFEGYRLAVVEKWLNQLRTGLTAQARENTKVMIVPVSGGEAQRKLDLLDPIKRRFVALNDPVVDQSLLFLRSEAARNIELATDQSLHARWNDISMGTTAPGQIFSDLFLRLDEDMRDLNEVGLISQAQYKVMYLSDGLLTPLAQNISDVLTINRECTGQNSAGFCSSLMASMKTSWGDPNLNSLATLDLKLSLIQALPKFYGSGIMDINFIQLQPDRVKLISPNAENMMVDLVTMATERFSQIRTWTIVDADPPFNLATPNTETRLFKMTNMFIFNPNVRLDQNGKVKVDTDGDGLFDEDEIELGFDPYVSRSNGFCLDSLMARQSFAPRCRGFAMSLACDPQLDSDGDGLNQCEEIVLGTDSFDFDTDGDSIPDFLEWMYGFNPLQSDQDLDTNGDGIPNLVNMAAGLGPNHYINSLPLELRGSYSIDYLDTELLSDVELGQVVVERYRVRLRHMLTSPISTLDLNHRDVLYLGRISLDQSNLTSIQIPEKHSVINCSIKPLTNRVVALVRLADETQPEVGYWRIMKFQLSDNFRSNNVLIDLSAFELMRTIDMNYANGGGL